VPPTPPHTPIQHAHLRGAHYYAPEEEPPQGLCLQPVREDGLDTLVSGNPRTVPPIRYCDLGAGTPPLLPWRLLDGGSGLLDFLPH
jgi:hypothetical protein